MTPRVVVVGGGITGLACAAALVDDAQQRDRPLDLTLFEAGPVAGGHARTTVADGFVVEHGPNGFLSREPHTLALVESLGLGARLVESRPEAKRRFILRGGRLCQVPDGPLTLATSTALSWRGKLRLAAEPFAPPPPPDTDETVHAFATRRIGAEAAEMLVDAAVSGISAGDSRRLSVQAQFPVMKEMERDHGSLVRAMFARRKRGAGPARLLSFDQGLATLTGALADVLGPRVRTGAAVLAVEHAGAAWRIRTADGVVCDADHVVLATPAHVSAGMIAGCDARLAAALDDVDYAGLAVVAMAFRVADVPRALDGYGYLATRPEGLATLGVVWESSLFPGRAPEGWVLMRAMLGGARRPDVVTLPEPAVVELADQELRAVLGVTTPPSRAWVFRWPRAIAQYTVGHLARRAVLADRVAGHRGLTICGTACDGVSFNHAVRSGRLAAHALADRLWHAAPATAPAGGQR